MPKPRKLKKKKLNFKTSLLDQRSQKFSTHSLLTNKMQNPQFFNTFGGLKLMNLCKSSSPKGKKLKELIFPEITQPKTFLSEAKKLPKIDPISQSPSTEKIIFNVQSFEELNEKKKEVVFLTPQAKDFARSEGVWNVSRVNFDCDMLPLGGDKLKKLDQIISYIKYKPRIREPFK